MRLLWPFLLVAACAGDTVRRPSNDDETQGSDIGTESETESESATETDSATDPGPCAPGMALVDDRFCIDIFEGALEERIDGEWRPAEPWYTVDDRVVRAVPADGLVPQGYISGAEAAAACKASGKRLCTSEEWLSACRGPQNHTWPYGDSYQASACNDHYEGSHPVVDYFGTSEGIWDPAHMNHPGINQQPGTLVPGGELEQCRSSAGAFDMHGNLHEWVSDEAGVFRGGFYADAQINGNGCTYRTTAHSIGYHDYSTGFRCCGDPR